MKQEQNKIRVLESIETWAKEAKKDIGHLTKTFERTFQRELHNWQEYDDISGIADSLVDIGSTRQLNFLCKRRKRQSKRRIEITIFVTLFLCFTIIYFPL